jgi:protease II
MVPGHDGEEIPVNLFYKKGNLKMNRRNRVLMEGYGAYGIPLPTGFDIIKTCAMERGWVIAQALVRGGGDRGTGWHE